MINTIKSATVSKQNVIAISEASKQWVKDTSDTFSAPLKSGGERGASEREIMDATIAFIEANRYQMEEVQAIDEDGELVFETIEELSDSGEIILVDTPVMTVGEVDLFERFLNKEMVKRLTNTQTRTSHLKSENEALKAQLAELLALQGK